MKVRSLSSHASWATTLTVCLEAESEVTVRVTRERQLLLPADAA